MQTSLLRALGVFLTVVLVASCGGGGGGGSGSTGPGATFSATSITLDSRFDTDAPSAGKDIHITLTNPAIVDFMVENLSGQDLSWLHMSLGGVGNKWTLSFVASSITPVGDHEVRLRLIGLSSSGAQIASQVITIRHKVLARLRATASTSMSFNFITLAAPAMPIALNVGGVGLDWTISTSNSFSLSASSGTGPSTVMLTVNPLLAPGTYNETITVSSDDGQSVLLPFAAVVLPPSFVVTPGSATFNAINGSPIASQHIAFNLNNNAAVTWSASSNAAWLGVSPTTGTTPSSIALSADPSQGPLAAGSYAAAATLTASGVNSKSIPVALNLTAPTLTAPASLTLGGTSGRDLTSRSLSLSLNTQTTAWPWTLTSKPEWLSPSTSSGTVNASGSSLTFLPVSSKATPGTNTGTLTFSSTANGDTVTRTVDVTFNLDRHRLLASTAGIAFSSTPGWTRLTRTVKVTDNYGAQTPWTASSSQSWLTVTPSGTTGASGTELQLTADASSLPDNTISYATVTISSSDTTILMPETIQIALWKGDTTPASTRTLSVDYNQIKADPIRPYLYAHANGTSIDVYHLYSGAKLATIASLGAALGDMTVSGDGKWLYVTDTTNAKVVVVDLATQTKSTSWSLQGSASVATHLAWTRSNGVELLFVGNGTAYVATSGQYLRNTGIGGVITASADGNYLYTVNEGYSPTTTMKYRIDYSDIGGGTLTITTPSNLVAYAGSNGRDVAVSHDGSFLYIASGSPYACIKNNAETMAHIGLLPEGDPYPGNVETSWDGRIACGLSSWYDPYDLWIHTEDGAVQSRHRLGGYARTIKPRQVVFSGDSLIVAAQTEDPYLKLIPIGP